MRSLHALRSAVALGTALGWVAACGHDSRTAARDSGSRVETAATVPPAAGGSSTAPSGESHTASAPAAATPVAARTAGAAAADPAEQITVRVARQISPSVVSVRRQDALGSGIIIQSDGVIITNAHVVGSARQVQVGLADGRELNGEVLGRDPSVDVAVVRVDGHNLPAAPLADSDDLVPGQTAIAIGNPLGLERTVTVGVVSAVNRSPRGFGLEGLIQTDAAISPGNSGGPLLNSNGQVIGITTAVIAAPGASNLGFAVPINLANDIAHQVVTTGRITRAFLGIDYRDIDEILAQQFGLPVDQGIIVAAVGRGTPAARAGLRQGDIITELDGKPLKGGGELRKALRARKPGDTVTLTVLRPGGTSTVKATLSEMSLQ
ncbi:MAG TPA: trypsin-like peptidase domain-containing protein [Gemmatimonadales bacterium]|nr:trypsin-like peptidase domain-containing protein [Gemmatimonadales bacterium]